MRDQKIRTALDQHWTASDVSDFETEHSIYHEDAVPEYPQSGEHSTLRTRSKRLRGALLGSNEWAHSREHRLR
jgi:hypothetical protein